MAVIQELFAGRTETLAAKSQAEIPYVIRQAADEAEVKATLIAGTPSVYDSIPRKSIEITERINADTWKAVVRYEESDNGSAPEDPTDSMSFDSTGGTQHITQSLETVARFGPAASEQLKGAIGFDGENINGVDITVPVWNWSETKYLSVVNTAAYFNLTGKVNSGGFRGYAGGEVLFMGASGQIRGSGPTAKWEVNFKFAASPNRSNFTVGDINVDTKKGWEYLWIQYAADVDPAKKVLIKKPVAVYIEKVYEEGNFGALGI